MIRRVVRESRNLLFLAPWVTVARVLGRSALPLPKNLSGKRVLLIQLNALGDSLMTTSLLRHLVASNPGVTVEVLCAWGNMTIFASNAGCSAVYGLRAGGKFQFNIATIRSLRRCGFDLAIDVSGLVISACIAALVAPSRIGFSRIVTVGLRKIEIGEYFSIAVPYDEKSHLAHQDLRLLIPLGIETSDTAMDYLVTSSANEKVALLLQNLGLTNRKFIVFAPGAKWFPKRWPEERWCQLCKMLVIDRRVSIVLVGSYNDTGMIDRICGTGNEGVHKIIGLPIDELAAVIELSAAVICNDSFVMHLAAALSRPTVALFGPVAPTRSAPKSKHVRVIYSEEFCSPCTLYFTAKRCWRGKNFCLYRIGPDEVCRTVYDLIDDGKRTS